jgi:hypothetical protein
LESTRGTIGGNIITRRELVRTVGEGNIVEVNRDSVAVDVVDSDSEALGITTSNHDRGGIHIEGGGIVDGIDVDGDGASARLLIRSGRSGVVKGDGKVGIVGIRRVGEVTGSSAIEVDVVVGVKITAQSTTHIGGGYLSITNAITIDVREEVVEAEGNGAVLVNRERQILAHRGSVRNQSKGDGVSARVKRTISDSKLEHLRFTEISISRESVSAGPLVQGGGKLSARRVGRSGRAAAASEVTLEGINTSSEYDGDIVTVRIVGDDGVHAHDVTSREARVGLGSRSGSIVDRRDSDVNGLSITAVEAINPGNSNGIATMVIGGWGVGQSSSTERHRTVGRVGVGEALGIPALVGRGKGDVNRGIFIDGNRNMVGCLAVNFRDNAVVRGNGHSHDELLRGLTFRGGDKSNGILSVLREAGGRRPVDGEGVGRV